MVYLAAPVKQTGGGNAGQMIIAGLSADTKEVPGSFGNFELATSHKMTRSVADEGGAAIGEETWSFAAASGENWSCTSNTSARRRVRAARRSSSSPRPIQAPI